MNYWQFRLKLYNESLKQWLDSLRQLSVGIVALFPLAMPALVFLPFVAWGILADSSSDNSLYLNTLWAYLLFLYSLMALQRNGIVAQQYGYYNASLAVSQSKQRWCELGLIIYSANVLLLVPLGLLVLMLYHASSQLLSLPISFIIEQLAPITGLVFLASYYCVSAVKKPRLPWLSLLLLPLFAVPWAVELAKAQWLVLWCVAIIFERQLPTPSLRLGPWPKGVYRLFLQADIAKPRSESLRLLALLLLVIMLRIMFEGAKPEVQSYIAGFLSFCAALLMASSLFDSQSLVRRYQHYFTSLPKSRFKLQTHCVLYCMLKTLPGLLLLASLNLFTAQHWALCLLFYISSLIGILYRPSWFFVFPIMSALAVFALSA